MKLIFLLSFLLTFQACQDTKEEMMQATITQASSKQQVNTEKETEEVDLSIIMGKFEPSSHPDFVEIEKKYADRAGLFLQRQTYDAYKEMEKAAREAGIELVIRSATRNFNYQKGIWERKWKANLSRLTTLDDKENALKILEYSSMPGTSRHHWGTDIDLNAFENSWFENGKGLQLYAWLQQNAGEYGFCQVYSEKSELRPNGYNEEKWHWSYMPIARRYYKIAEVHMDDNYLTGFAGAEVATDIKVVDKYILGINKNCN